MAGLDRLKPGSYGPTIIEEFEVTLAVHSKLF